MTSYRSDIAVACDWLLLLPKMPTVHLNFCMRYFFLLFWQRVFWRLSIPARRTLKYNTTNVLGFYKQYPISQNFHNSLVSLSQHFLYSCFLNRSITSCYITGLQTLEVLLHKRLQLKLLSASGHRRCVSAARVFSVIRIIFICGHLEISEAANCYWC